MVLAQIFPQHRTWIMTVGGGGLFLFKKLNQLQVTSPFWFAFDTLMIVGFLYLFYRIAKSFAKLPKIIKNHPQLFLHALLWVGIGLMFLFPAEARRDPSRMLALNLTACLVFFAFLIWRIGFMLYSGKRGTIKQQGFVEHLIYCLPYLGSSQVPYGKGLDYLNSKRSTDRLELARIQLAGLKLLLLASIWELALTVVDAAFFSTAVDAEPLFRLHHISELIAISTLHMPGPVTIWGSLIVDMVYETTQLAITGHLIIGCLRLFGFNLFRNTYKPLLARTLIDFWNRYYFYFKELLVDFFFFPVYLAVFKHHPKLRIFAATMASACLGNLYYHVLQHFDLLMITGNLPSFARFSSYLFYSFVLGLAIFVSILREQNQRGQPHVQHSIWVTLRKIAGVWIFFALLRIWDHSSSAFMQDTTFFLAIFGIRL
ncbi:MAG: hypothetical protein G8237_00895 [Magnetococcales bacterium]|nr:hypothetical protein [Magnetococcales bacterium]NGZ04894.1 hypothetical protein [Magnetococcales bacterium]